MIRGDSFESTRLARALAFVRERELTSDAALVSLFESPPPNVDADVVKLLRQIHEAGGWVLVESTLADLPADLRWLYESGAVSLEQLGAIHGAFGATSSADLAAAIQEGPLERAGLDAKTQDGIVKALPHIRSERGTKTSAAGCGRAERLAHLRPPADTRAAGAAGDDPRR